MRLRSYDFQKIAETLVQLEGISVDIPVVEVGGLRLALLRESSHRGEVSVSVTGIEVIGYAGQGRPDR